MEKGRKIQRDLLVDEELPEEERGCDSVHASKIELSMAILPKSSNSVDRGLYIKKKIEY